MLPPTMQTMVSAVTQRDHLAQLHLNQRLCNRCLRQTPTCSAVNAGAGGRRPNPWTAMCQRQHASRLNSAAHQPGPDGRPHNLQLQRQLSRAGDAHLKKRCITPEAGFAAFAQQQLDISRLPPVLQQQWDHPKNAHLGSISIKPGSNIPVWWTCDKCQLGLPHKWLATANNRTSLNQTGCPYCADKSICPHNSLATQAPTLAAQWSNKNRDKPDNYTCGSGVAKLWHCEQCGHEWSARIANRAKCGQGCPDCARIKRRTRQRQPPVADSSHPMAYWDCERNEKQACILASSRGAATRRPIGSADAAPKASYIDGPLLLCL